MKKQIFGIVVGFAFLSSGCLAQVSVGVMGGAGYLFQRTEGTLANSTLVGVKAAQPLATAGIYGQFTSKGKLPVLAGLQVRYQWQQQSQQFTAMNPNNPLELTDPQYNRYNYIIASPYVGLRLLKKLDVAVGPELSFLQSTKIISFLRMPTERLTGYTVRATYRVGRFGLEGGYTNVKTSFDSQQQQNGETIYRFYNRYAFLALKLDLLR